MKLSRDILFLVTSTLSLFVIVTEANRTLLAAVTPVSGSGLQNYYLNMKFSGQYKSGPSTERELSRPKIRREVCTAVMQSDFFYMRQIEAVDPNAEAVQADLAQNRPEIYERLYRRENASEELRFVDAFEPRTVVVDSYNQTFLESVFSCLGKDRVTGHVVEYFVSSKYGRLLFEDGADAGMQIEGFFVFTRKNESAEDLEVIALAEKSCELIGRDDGKMKRVEAPICHISDMDKVRTCALILSAKTFRYKYRFLPTIENVDTECISNGDDYDVNLIGCKAENIETGMQKIIYISHYEPPCYFGTCEEKPCSYFNFTFFMRPFYTPNCYI